MEIDNPLLFATLGNPHRLKVWRLLMRRYPDTVPAGEIASATELKNSTLSVYLSGLRQAGLVEQVRHGTSLQYRARMDAASEMLDYLFADCCRGRPDLCLPDPRGLRDGTRNVLFLCTGNSARSLFAETLLNRFGGKKFRAFSAGTHPAVRPHPMTLRTLDDEGFDRRPLTSKSVDHFRSAGAPPIDVVITVCDDAANEECPAWPGAPVSGHWSTPDPTLAQGTEAERLRAFRDTFNRLRHRITMLCTLPPTDRAGLQKQIDDIALERLAQ